jgi:hypothetical protein
MVAGAFCPEDGITSVVYVKSAVDKLTGQEDSSATNDASYVITDEELNNVCTLHTEESLEPSDTPDGETPDEETPPNENPVPGGGNGSLNEGGGSTPDDEEEPDDSPDEEEPDDSEDDDSPE